MLRCLVALTAVFPGAVLAAVVWTWVDEQGQRHYSDREVPGATQIEIGEAQTFSGSALRSGEAAPAAQAPQAPPSAEPAAANYSILDVVSPEPDETFWNIGGELPVTIATFPALQATHRIDVSIDGQRRELDTRSLEITVSEVWRGEHTLQALIVDVDGNILMRSAPVSFYVHQTSILN
jgi:hypothetical protein